MLWDDKNLMKGRLFSLTSKNQGLVGLFLPHSICLWNHTLVYQILDPKFWTHGMKPSLDLGFPHPQCQLF